MTTDHPQDTTTARSALKALIASTNTHNFDNVAPHLTDDVVYLFTDRVVRGREAARAYFTHTWATIVGEIYAAEDIEWLIENDDTAVATYRFSWRGVIDGTPSAGDGRATNVFVRDDSGEWRLAHEHLSGA